jgi:YVTN family beta-propeller protein
MMFNKNTLTLFSIVFMASSLNTFSQTHANFHILKSYPLSGDGGWDYLTVEAKEKIVYASHGNEVNILNIETGKEIGKITNTIGVHGIVLVNSLGKGYVSNGRDNSCTVFDIKTNKELKKIITGANPDAIFYDNFSKKIFTCNGRSEDASVIDPITDKVVATIPLGGKPETAVSNGKGLIFVNIETTNEVVVFDAKTYKIKNRYKLEGGEEPSGLAIDLVTNRLFVGCGGNHQMIVMDALTGRNLAKFNIGDCDGVVFDPIYKQAYSSNREGTITIIKEVNANKFEFVKNIETEFGCRTIALNPINHHLFTLTAKTEAVAPTKENPRPWSKIVPGTFHVLEIGE